MARQRLLARADSDVMTGHAHAALGTAFWTVALMWCGMMSAMMAPTAWPWVRTFHRFNSNETGATARFASGYLLAWLGYAVVAALMQVAFQRMALMPSSGDVVRSSVGAVIFLLAGLYQFAPLKRACLTHCRSPLGYFLTRWRNGPMGAFRMGLHHGLFCVGCCWALMATAFAIGVMNLWWMAALGALALTEQIAPQGQMLRRALGCAFVVVGLFRLTRFV